MALVRFYSLKRDLTAASTYDKYSIDPSILMLCTRCSFTMTMIQTCSELIEPMYLS